MVDRSLLLFTRTTGYRHDSIPSGVACVRELAQADGVDVVHTEDEAVFTDADLARFDAVVWLQVCGDVLTDPGRAAFDAWLRGGGGWAGIHCAADAERGWPAFESIVGARFLGHPSGAAARQTATVHVEAAHPSTTPIPDGWRWEEEWYAFTRDPRGEVDVLLTVDERTYDPEEYGMGDHHPVCWAGRYGAGRTWYTALGHRAESYADPVLRAHLRGGISSVLR